MHDLFALLMFALPLIVVQRARRRKEAARDRPPPPEASDDERTRRVQEEIRRKIERRRAGTSVEAEEASEPAPAMSFPQGNPIDPFGGPRPAQPDLPPMLRRVLQPAAPARSEEDERRRRLAERVERAERARIEAQRRAAEAERGAGETAPAFIVEPESVAAPAPSSWREELRNPATLRRAIVLREILGSPVSLRPNLM